MSRGAVPVAVRVLRIAHAALHLVRGLATIAVAFPFVSRRKREQLIRRWSNRLLAIFAMSKVLEGRVHEREGRGLVLVANHVSWIDIFVINAIQPAHFIAKAELARWPVIGWLIRGVGTLFIDRSSRRHLHDANRRIAGALERDDVVAIFPEGEVRNQLGAFHGSLLQPVIDRNAPMQALAIRYFDGEGNRTTVTFYANRNFLQCIWRMTAEPRLKVHVTCAPAVPASGQSRGELAAAAEGFIRAVLA